MRCVETEAKNMEDDKSEEFNKPSDRKNLFLLLVLNTLYHLPKSITYAFSLHLQSRGASLIDQAKFSWVIYPASCGLLWAPIVDTFYFSKFGRRKSWLIPSQLLAGVFYLVLCIKMNEWLGDVKLARKPKILEFTLLFLLLNLAAETQRISVSGWSLTLISRQNIVHTGHCKVIGKAISFFLGYVVCSLLESQEVYEEWFSTTEKPAILPSLAGYFGFWAAAHLLVTILLLFYKEETVEIVSIKTAFVTKIVESYKLPWKIMQIKPVVLLCVIVFTNEMGFGPTSGIAVFKLVEGGISRHKLVLVLIPVTMLFPLLPWLLKKYGFMVQRMQTYLILYGFRIFFCLALDQIILYMPELKIGKTFSTTFYAVLFLSSGLERICDYFMELIYQGFVAEVSDPTVGGTYVTFINTANDLGKVIPRSLSLWAVDKLHWKRCGSIRARGCPPVEKCRILVDGYHIEVLIGILYSFLWLAFFGTKTLLGLELLDKSSWLLQPNNAPYF